MGTSYYGYALIGVRIEMRRDEDRKMRDFCYGSEAAPQPLRDLMIKNHFMAVEPPDDGEEPVWYIGYGVTTDRDRPHATLQLTHSGMIGTISHDLYQIVAHEHFPIKREWGKVQETFGLHCLFIGR